MRATLTRLKRLEQRAAGPVTERTANPVDPEALAAAEAAYLAALHAGEDQAAAMFAGETAYIAAPGRNTERLGLAPGKPVCSGPRAGPWTAQPHDWRREREADRGEGGG